MKHGDWQSSKIKTSLSQVVTMERSEFGMQKQESKFQCLTQILIYKAQITNGKKMVVLMIKLWDVQSI